MISVVKNSGKKEPFDAEKINEMCTSVAEGLAVSPSTIALKAQISIYDGIHTSQIQKELVEAARDLATVEEPDYLIAAGRLMMSDLRKQVYGQYDPLPLYDIIYENISLGRYDKEILEKYTKEEIDFFDQHIVHERDMFIPQAAALTFKEKYLIKDKITGTVFETPQVAMMLIGICLLSERPNRTEKILKFYDRLSNNKFSLPSPIMAGVRSPTRQFSSCCLIDSDDDLDAINATANSVVKYASKRAGIGINGGRVRALGSPVRGGEITHTGCINFYKMWQAALHSCSQGGLRNASATLYYPWWHYEAQDLLVLKNNKGTESNRVRHLDYGFQMNRLFLERVKNNQMVSLFSPHENKELYESFFMNQDKFDEIYHAMEANPLIRQKKVKALDLFILFMTERSGTGRIYPNFVDHMNDYSVFDEPIYMSNLCLEIALPTKPIFNIKANEDENDGEIALCTLAAYNLGNIEEDEIEEIAYIMVEALDELLDYQDYPVNAAKHALKRRSLGVGVTNYSYWLAKNGFKYSNRDGNNATFELFEKLMYNLMKASVQLAKEKGACEWFHKTKYARGIMPIDNYKKDVDELHTTTSKMDWDSLRADVLKYGMRNSTLMALMPSETSSVIANATNGIEPQRGPISIKAGKDGNMKMIVPEYHRLREFYEFVWDIPDNVGYLEKVALMQVFVDQAISTNLNYDPYRYPENKVPMRIMTQDIYRAYRWGLKTVYYHNTRDKRGLVEEDDKAEETVMPVADEAQEQEPDCEGCKI